MTKEKRFVFDPFFPSLSTSLSLPACDIYQKVMERHALYLHMFEIWKNLGIPIRSLP